MSNRRLTLMRDHKEFVLQLVLNIEQTDKFTARKGYFFTFLYFYLNIVLLTFQLHVLFFVLYLSATSFHLHLIILPPFSLNNSFKFVPAPSLFINNLCFLQILNLKLSFVFNSSFPASHSSAHFLLL